jgi:hypothetical protein
MSAPTEPYANGFGILAGLAVLWIGTLAILFAVKSFWPQKTAPAEPGAQSSLPRAVLEVAAVPSREAHEALRPALAGHVLAVAAVSRG